MIVPRSEIHLANSRRKRVLWVPAERGSIGELKPCKHQPGDLVSLQPAPFVKGTAVTVTSIEPHPRLLDDMTDQDAALVGYQKIRLAKETWGRQHGQTIGRSVWVVHFALGDHTEFMDGHRERYLRRKGVGLTDDPKKAIGTEPAVTTAEQLKLAAKAREKRGTEERQRLVLRKRAWETLLADLRGAGYEEKDVRFVERRLAAMNRKRAEILETAA
jgi:hypothetical protein